MLGGLLPRGNKAIVGDPVRYAQVHRSVHTSVSSGAEKQIWLVTLITSENTPKTTQPHSGNNS